MRLPLYRPLQDPEPPVAGSPDFWEQAERYWRETNVWWENWRHNFIVSLILWPGLTALAVIILAVVVS